MSVHPVAAGGFSAAAPTNPRIRPAHARAVIGAIKERVPRGSLVLDLDSGTGILAGALRRARLDVVAVEPSPRALGELVRTLPDVPVVRAAAPHLPFRDRSAGAITLGGAVDRLAVDGAVAECRRVLRVGAMVALVQDVLDRSVEWVADYDEIVRAAAPAAAGSHELAAAGLDAAGLEGPEELRAPNPRACSPRQLVRRAATDLDAAGATPEVRDGALARVHELVASHPGLVGRPTFDLPCVTQLSIWWST